MRHEDGNHLCGGNGSYRRRPDGAHYVSGEIDGNHHHLNQGHHHHQQDKHQYGDDANLDEDAELHHCNGCGENELLNSENDFTLKNSFWFSISTLMQQGSDLNPKVFL